MFTCSLFLWFLNFSAQWFWSIIFTNEIIDYIIFFFSMSLVRRKHMEHSPQITKTLLKKSLWPLFMNGVQLPQGHSHFEEAVYFIPLSSQKFLELILSTSEGWKLSRPYTVLGIKLMQNLFAWSDFGFDLICHVLHQELELYLSKYQITNPSKSLWEWGQWLVFEHGKPVCFHYFLIKPSVKNIWA